MELSAQHLIITHHPFSSSNSTRSSQNKHHHHHQKVSSFLGFSNFPSNSTPTSSFSYSEKLNPLRRRGGGGGGSGDGAISATSDSSSAMEQLDFERGVCIPFRKYTPETVRKKCLESNGAALSLVGRGVEIVWKLGLYWSALLSDFLIGRDEEVVPFRARQLRNLLCDLGPSFIKAGQVLANRPDIIREDYMSELCILQDDVPPFPNEVAFTIIEEELGKPLEAVFSKISSQTIAAASLGQVYRATLRDTGEDVAIKVLYGITSSASVSGFYSCSDNTIMI